MAGSEAGKNIVNRVIAFLAGALVVFAVMNFTVVDSSKKQNAELTAALDASQFQAGRLVSEARAQLEDRDYEKARSSLALLFDKHPGSAESVDGKTLLAAIDMAEKTADAKWAAAEPAIKQKWVADRMAELRSESEAARVQMEKEIADKVTNEWDRSQVSIRREWETAKL